VPQVFREVANLVQDRLRRGEIPVSSKELHGISYAPLHMQGSRVSGTQHSLATQAARTLGFFFFDQRDRAGRKSGSVVESPTVRVWRVFCGATITSCNTTTQICARSVAC